MIECPYNCGMFRSDRGLLICRPSGVLTSEQAQDILVCQKCLRKLGLRETNRFHDLTGITGVDLNFFEMTALAREERKIRKDHASIKVCYLVPNDVLYVIVRMYQALIEDDAVEVHVSRKLSDLANVLNIDDKELYTELGVLRGDALNDGAVYMRFDGNALN